MSPTPITLQDDAAALFWRVLRLLNLYRLLVPTVLLLVFSLGGEPRLVGAAHAPLFEFTALAYFLTALASVLILKQRWPGPVGHVYAPVAADIVAMTFLAYASGGAESGLGSLLLLPVGAASLLGTPRQGLFLAAAATLAFLGQQSLTWLKGSAGLLGFLQAGLYSALLFVLAAAAAFLARRLSETEAEVRQRDVDVANLAQLSEYIVQHLRESVVVVDSEDRIRLINPSAREMLGAGAAAGALLGEISPRLLYLVESWRREPAGSRAAPAIFLAADGSREIESHFAPLGRDRPASVIAFLEDTTQLAERVQQSKLAALGRLSASIAHEIRNPVGAMSHAAQLLAETASLAPEERRLTEIITANAERVSTIIANVLQLSRREATRPERLNVGDWLEDFVNEFRATLELPPERLNPLYPEQDFEVRVDPTHLHQIIWNLCDNAVRHSDAQQGAAPVELRIGRIGSSGRPFLEVADRGGGIRDVDSERIFEPFFTGRQGGTGLGLFIARELAQCNGALLLYEPRAGGGSIFRVIFSDPQRWED
jgi:two-component system, NtrC family, sensor histidine kinase PilS